MKNVGENKTFLRQENQCDFCISITSTKSHRCKRNITQVHARMSRWKPVHLSYYLFLLVSLATVFPSRKVTANNVSVPIPILSTSLNMDNHNYLPRLLRSIDYPVSKIIVQIGNANETIVESIVAAISRVKTALPGLNIIVHSLDYNPGSAAGFNVGLRELAASRDASWCLVVNSDISFYPGVLGRLAKGVEEKLIEDPFFGLGFTSLCCGSEWSAVVFTRKVVDKVGLFDENFYPAYYEDDDYAIRTYLAGLKAHKFNNTALHHGELDGSKDYLSGLFVSLYLHPKKDVATELWRKTHELGVKHGQTYIETKWNIKMGTFKNKSALDCKSLQGINSKCRPGYTLPFNKQNGSLADWTINEIARDKLLALERSHGGGKGHAKRNRLRSHPVSRSNRVESN